jgi:hypothetical protein
LRAGGIANCHEADDLIANSFGDATKIQKELEDFNMGKLPAPPTRAEESNHKKGADSLIPKEIN